MKSFYKLSNAIQNYAWGSTDGISSLTGIENPDMVPMAELWMGTHYSAPSKVMQSSPEDQETLQDIVQSDLRRVNQSGTGDRQGLPYLFKLISVASPLSLQVHPTVEQAIIGYARENAAGITLDAPNRNYKDQNHKPEILAALTPFTALCGFRTVTETVENFRRLGIAGLSGIVGKLEETGDYRAFIKALLCMVHNDSRNICRALGKILSEDNGPIDAANGSFRRAKDTAKGIFGKYPDDLGSLAPFYLNVVILNPGEAIFLSPGIMHAYLEGTGFELMANSDNVLRGGLTPKYIDIPELLTVMDSRPYNPRIITPVDKDGILCYPTPVREFRLCRGKTTGNSALLPSSAPTILMCVYGTVTLSSIGGESLALTQGEVCYLRPQVSPITISGSGEFWCATIPFDAGAAI